MTLVETGEFKLAVVFIHINCLSYIGMPGIILMIASFFCVTLFRVKTLCWRRRMLQLNRIVGLVPSCSQYCSDMCCSCEKIRNVHYVEFTFQGWHWFAWNILSRMRWSIFLPWSVLNQNRTAHKLQCPRVVSLAMFFALGLAYSLLAPLRSSWLGLWDVWFFFVFLLRILQTV